MIICPKGAGNLPFGTQAARQFEILVSDIFEIVLEVFEWLLCSFRAPNLHGVDHGTFEGDARWREPDRFSDPVSRIISEQQDEGIHVGFVKEKPLIVAVEFNQHLPINTTAVSIEFDLSDVADLQGQVFSAQIRGADIFPLRSGTCFKLAY
jgi:hypothetical protein